VFGSDETDPCPEPKKSTHTLFQTTSCCFTSILDLHLRLSISSDPSDPKLVNSITILLAKLQTVSKLEKKTKFGHLSVKNIVTYQDRQFSMHNVTLRRVRVTTVAVEKQ
jgi:hypothetical protein